MSKFKRSCVILLCIISVFCFGCNKNQSATKVVDTENNEKIDVKNIVINIPTASGTVIYGQNGTNIDASNTKDGYIMVKHTGSSKTLKVKVIKGENSYNYDLNNIGNYEVYPLQMGNGTYTIKIYENVEGTSYIALYSVDFEVQMDDLNRVFIFPNQYVWYTNANMAIEKSFELCAKAGSDEQKAQIIFDYIIANIQYDNDKASKVAAGYLPDVDETLASGKGICFDYAALMAAMLRAQNIPTRLVIGNVEPENILHAWNQVYINGKWIWMDSTFGSKNKHKETNYTENRRY